jgi:hypothetical protein
VLNGVVEMNQLAFAERDGDVHVAVVSSLTANEVGVVGTDRGVDEDGWVNGLCQVLSHSKECGIFHRQTRSRFARKSLYSLARVQPGLVPAARDEFEDGKRLQHCGSTWQESSPSDEPCQ